MVAAEVVYARLRLVHVPEDVRRDRIQPHRLQHPHARGPLRARNAGVVHLAAQYLEGFAIQHKVIALHMETMFLRARSNRRLCRCHRRARGTRERDHGTSVAYWREQQVS